MFVGFGFVVIGFFAVASGISGRESSSSEFHAPDSMAHATDNLF